eukprot:9254182-Pyramimonas_sp.AAC.1
MVLLRAPRALGADVRRPPRPCVPFLAGRGHRRGEVPDRAGVQGLRRGPGCARCLRHDRSRS